VLHILFSIEFSGLEVMLADAASAFDANHVEVHVLCTTPGESGMAGRFADLGFVVHRAPAGPSARSLLWLRRLLLRQHYDAVHIHTEQAFFWYGAVCRLSGVRHLVYTVHSTYLFRGLLRWERVALRRAARTLLGMQILAISPSVADNERRRFFSPSTASPNWVDTHKFHPATAAERCVVREGLGLPADAPVIVSVGGCIALKRHELILLGLRLLVDELPDLHYLHVGSGPEEDAERTLAEDLGIAGSCLFLGRRDDVAALLAASDVLVMPSAVEGFGLAALEAMSCGLPVVATDVPGLRDLVVAGRTGKLAADSPESIASALASLLDDAELRHRMGVEGRQTALRGYSIATGLAVWLRAYGIAGPAQ
jgi:glycosyltransferase involved in cell wall biosynthesis